MISGAQHVHTGADGSSKVTYSNLLSIPSTFTPSSHTHPSTDITDWAEAVQDTAGAMFIGNTETGIDVVYQDADGTVDLVVNTEWVQDLIGAMLTGNTETGLTVTYQDADGTIDFAIDSGTSNPGSPSTGDLFYRTDLHMWVEYDGARWLSVHEYSNNIEIAGVPDSGRIMVTRIRADHNPYYTRVAVSTRVNNTNNGSHYWIAYIQGVDVVLGSGSTIYTLNTISDTVNVVTDHEGNPSDPTPVYDYFMSVYIVKNGAPGSIDIWLTYYYRLIIT